MKYEVKLHCTRGRTDFDYSNVTEAKDITEAIENIKSEVKKSFQNLNIIEIFKVILIEEE